MKTKLFFLPIVCFLFCLQVWAETVCSGEAEHYVANSFKGGANEPFVATDTNYSGGAAVYGVANSMTLLYNFYVEAEGTYELAVDYCYTGDKAPEQGGHISVRINNQVKETSPALTPQGAQPGETVQQYVTYIYCEKGWNVLRLGQNGNGKYHPYLDRWEVRMTDEVLEKPADDTDTKQHLSTLFPVSFTDKNYYSWDLTEVAGSVVLDEGCTSASDLATLTDNDLATVFVSEDDEARVLVEFDYPVVVKCLVLNDVLRLGRYDLEAWDEAGQVWKSLTKTNERLFTDGALWNVTSAGDKDAYTKYRLSFGKAPGAPAIEVADVLLVGYYYTKEMQSAGKTYYYMIDDLTTDNNGAFISCTTTPDEYNGLVWFETLDNARGSKFSVSATSFQLVYEFNTSAKVSSFVISNATTRDRDIKTFEIQGSNDNVNYTTLYRAEDILWKMNNLMYGGVIEQPDFYKYYRLDFQKNNGSGSFAEISDWMLFGEVTPGGEPTWRMKRASIMTQWSEDIDPESVWQEYPRPQKVRDEWMNLNGVWQLRKGTADEGYSDAYTYDKRILVPFPVESAISGIMDNSYKDESPRTFFYKREVEIPETMRGKRILLHFGAADWHTEVWVNGKPVGEHKGGYDPFTFDITGALADGEVQELVVKVTDWTDSKSHFGLVGKQSNAPGNVFYVPVTGIWQTVWIEPVPESFIDDFEIVSDIDRSQVKVTVIGNNPAFDGEVRVSVYDKGTFVRSAQGAPGQELSIDIPGAKLWGPSSPFLYDLKLELLAGGAVVDSVKSYFGMRKVYKAEHNGATHMFINDEPIFTFGVLDQGYWPDGLYTPPSDEAMRYDLLKTREFGFNMNRKHIKVEPARWYYHCDTMGIVVWQDIPGGRRASDYEEHIFEDYRANYLHEAGNIIKSLKNCPSIVTWVLFNERWGQFAADQAMKDAKGRYLTNDAYAMAQTLIKDKCLINVGSGSDDFGIGDYKDRHSYPAPAKNPHPGYEVVEVCGEYGGVSLSVPGHMWSYDGFSYIKVKTGEELTEHFVRYADGVMGLQADNLTGAVYTQLTDVEIEVNGLMTYDRLMKTDEQQTARIRASVERNIKNACTEYIRSARNTEDNRWKYTTTYQKDWQTVGFDDSTWKEGAAGFGKGNVSNSNIRTDWSTPTIYLRRQINLGNLSQELINGLALQVFHDEDFEVYINGVLAASGTGFLKDYTMYPISKEALATIRPNENNVVAVKCTQSSGGQYIDVAFTIAYPRRGEKPLPPQSSLLSDVFTAGNAYSIVPNPVKGSFSITGDVESIRTVELLDLSGKCLKHFGEILYHYDVSDLGKGIYFVLINSLKGKAISKIMLN